MSPPSGNICKYSLIWELQILHLSQKGYSHPSFHPPIHPPIFLSQLSN